MDKEIKELFKQPKDYKFNLNLLMNLKNNNIDANIALIHAISKIQNEFDLLALVLILRYGANPNLYIKFNKNSKKTIHIIGFVYTNKDTIKFFDSVINILLLSKSNTYKKIYNNSSNEKNISNWVFDNYRENINTKINKLYDEDFNILSILLNNFHLQKKEFIKENNYICIKSFSDLLPKIPDNNSMSTLDYNVLILSLDVINKDAFKYYLNLNKKPSYLLIIKLILKINKCKINKEDIVYNELLEILKYCIMYGVQLDNYQWELLKINNDEKKELLTIYEKPFWEKLIIKDSDIVSEELKNIAISLNISYINNNIINNEIKELQKIDKTALKNSYLKLQQNKLNSISIGEDIDDINNILFNKNVFDVNPLDFNNYFVVFYKDYNNLFWCFYYDKFEDILKNRYNPYNNTILSEDILLEIKFKLDFIKTINSDYIIKLYSKAVDNIHDIDKINNNKSNIEMDKFIKLIQIYDINKNVNYKSNFDLERRLKLINIFVNLKDFDINFSLIITARIINRLYNLNKDITPFFN